MKKGLSYKLILIYVIILGFILSTLAVVLAIWFRENYFDDKKAQFEQTSVYLSKVIDMYDDDNNAVNDDKGSLGSNELQAVINMASTSIDAKIFLCDENNKIYMTSNSDEYELGIEDEIEIVQNSKNSELLAKGNCVELINDFYIYSYPFQEDSSFSGYAIMASPVLIINNQLKKIYLIVWISSICTMIMSIIVLTYFAKKILINPLSLINNIAKKYANGEFYKRVEIKSNDEIEELAESINLMAESLEKVENNRREFISNVSHELRSPITSIKGFIAGIIDGVIPKDKEGYYLTRAYSEIQRLTRLINDLLDLSAIDSGKLKFNIKKVNINEIIRMCLINNERKIKEKGIIVSIELYNEKCYVNSDEDRTMQVITNLLDNSIKYCEVCGNIKISTYLKNQKVWVEIYNDGPNLTQEEVIHIWDRFYKSDKSRTNKVSTGLGLPIIKMIIMQQGEEIYAKNHKGKGVSFIFSLSIYK